MHAEAKMFLRSCRVWCVIFHQGIPAFHTKNKLLPLLPYAPEKSQISFSTKPDFVSAVLFVHLHRPATKFTCQTVDASYLNLWDLLNRHCVECQHFKRGQYIDDNSCSRICKDEIKVVDQISE